MKKNAFIFFTLIFYECRPSNCVETNVAKLGKNIEIVEKVDKCNGTKSIQQFTRVSSDSVVKDGFYKSFYQNGQLELIAFYKNNVQDSITIGYRKDGTLLATNYFVDGIQQGFQNQFYNDGRIKVRNYHLSDTSLLFLVKFDTGGRITETKGRSQRHILARDINTFHRGDTLVVLNRVVVFEEVETALRVYLTVDGQKLIHKTTSKFHSNRNMSFDLTFIPIKKSGHYNYTTIASITEKRTDIVIKHDTIHYNFVVK